MMVISLLRGWLLWVLSIIPLLLLPVCPALATMDTPTASAQADLKTAEGRRAFQRGDFEQAALSLQTASDLYTAEGALEQRIDVLMQLAEAYQALGQQRKSLQALQLAHKLVEQISDRIRMAAILGSLGKAYFLSGSLEQAERHLEASIAMARKAGDSRVAAAGLNDLGNLMTAQGNYRKARAAYGESVRLAQRANSPSLAAKALTNAARAALQDSDYPEAERLAATALEQVQGLRDAHDKAYGLIALGQLMRDLHATVRKPKAQWLALVYQALSKAADIATELGDRRTAAYAWGHLGQLYEAQRRYQDALQLTRRAVFSAQQANVPEILYRWQWQTGRLLRAQGDSEGAISAYRQAIAHLQSIRHDLSVSYTSRHLSFREAVGPVFFELADLLLQRAPITEDPRQRERYLFEARETVEQLKAAELQDYFQDECVTALQARITRLDRLAPRTAAVYPIILPDRTELLLSLSEGIKQFTVPISGETLTQAVREFRRNLEKRTTREYLPDAQRLYQWLIGPLEAELKAHHIATLIFVPDGPLRTVPMAALHDGKAFLISQYALATTPGLTLTDLRPIQRQDMRLLLNGLTEAVQGFSALEHVSLELNAIQALYGGTRLQNEDFQIPKVEQALTETPYSIVHIASHGQFASEVDDTFLLTFDDKLTMDRLERFISLSQFRDRPVELLTLSACQTAAGDDRAALGLAGIAIKAGARSALATLWLVNDEASALLVMEFYRQLQLQNATLSKAEALQQAQLKLLTDRRYQHPGYWAPFLLIGNWL